MKITILGAAGKVGTEIIRLLAGQDYFKEKLEVVLFTPHNVQKIQGFLMDLEEALFIRNKKFSHNVKFLPTNNFGSLSESELVIICAGLFADEKEKKQCYLSDPSGRSIQSLKNYPIIEEMCKQIKRYAPSATLIVVTNQADIMTQKARDVLISENIYGLGCYLDTIRFKKIFSEITGLTPDEFDAVVLGFHNRDMFLSEAGFHISREVPGLENKKNVALQKTILRGKEISDLQKDRNHPEINSGSSKLPGAAVYSIIEAFTQKRKKLQIPLNRKLLQCEADGYAQMPCLIRRGKITAVPAALTANDRKNLRRGIASLQSEIDKLNIIYKQQQGTFL